MKKRNQTRGAVCVQPSREVLAVLEEYLDLNPSDPARRKVRLQRFINSHLYYRRKMTPEQFVQLYEWQNKKCAICEKRPARGPKAKFMFDHDHNPPHLLRGLLCTRCNRELEYYEEFGQRIVAYITHPPAQQAGLRIVTKGDFWRGLPALSAETSSRLQHKLDSGTALQELRRTEPDLGATRFASYVKKGLLRLPDATIGRIRTLRASGMPQPQIAKAVGVSESIVKWQVSNDVRDH